MKTSTSRHLSKRIVSFALCVAIALGLMPAGLPSTAEAASAASYVTDDLVLYLDANNNTGTGAHDSTATGWVNLADPEQTIELNGQSWGSDENGAYLDFTNNYIILPDEVRQAIGGENFTIEFIMDDYTSKDTGNIINVMCVTGDDAWIAAQTSKGGVINDNFVLFVSQGQQEIKFRTAWWNSESSNWDITVKNTSSYARADGSTINGKTNTLTFDHDGYSYYYVDGTLATNGASQNLDGKTISLDGFKIGGTWQTERKPQVVFGAAADVVSGRSFDANVKGIRVYKDTLTAEEAARNAAYDQEHYYGEEEIPTITVPDGYVTDNLVLYLDANLNTGTGYDAEATTWKNLAAAGEEIAINGQTWGSDGVYQSYYLSFANNYILLPDTVRQALAGSAFTVEFVLDGFEDGSGITNIMCVTGSNEYIAQFKANGGTKNPGSVVNDNFVIWSDPGSGKTMNLRTYYGTKPWSAINNYATSSKANLDYKSHALIFSSTAGNQWYQNGILTSTGKNSVSGQTITLDGYLEDGVWQTERLPQIAFGAATDVISSRYFTANVRAIRIYSDALTAEEIAQNALADAGRYYTEASADHIHQYEWTVTDEGHGYACSVDGCTGTHDFEEHGYTNDDDASCNTCGYTRAIKSVISSYDVDIYEPVTDVNAAPIIMQAATSAICDVSDETKRPSAVIATVKMDSDILTAYAEDGTPLGAWADLYIANDLKTNMGVRIEMQDTAAANALAAWAQTERAGNLWVISNDVEMLTIVTSAMPTIRGVVDFTGHSVRGPGNIKFNFDNDGTAGMNTAVGGDYSKNATRTYDWVTYTKGSAATVYENMDWADVYDLIFAEGYRTILIPESAATNDHIYFLQGSLVYTIVETAAATEKEIYDLIVAGPNGILTTGSNADYIGVLEGDLFDANGENILVRGGSIVGHRGDMGYHVKGQLTLPENSVESIVSAAQSGASSVEFDMYMTLDGELVLNHNASIDGYFVYADDCPLAEEDRIASTVGITSRYWYGDLEYMVSTYNSNIKMQRLYQLYEAVDNEYPELRLHHEIKDGRIETLNRTIELMDQYGLRDRSDMMCFTKSVVAYTNSMGISSQYLATVSRYTDDNRMYVAETAYRDVNSTWHAGWGAINMDFVEELKHYGQTAYPWPTYSSNYAGYYVQGYQGFTTDAPHHTDDLIRELVLRYDSSTGEASAIATTLADHAKGTTDTTTKSGEAPITLPDYLDKWWVTKGASSGENVYEISDGLEIVILEGEENVAVNGNTIVKKDAAESGKATIAVRYLQTISGSSYYTYSRAVEIEAVDYDHTHNFSTGLTSNDTHHWRACVADGCMETDVSKLDGYAEHSYTDDSDWSCNDCGYERTISKVPAGYETDGLVLFLDGVDNTGTGTHDSESGVWVNLASIAEQVVLPDGTVTSTVNSKWGSNYLDLDGYIKLPASVHAAIASGEFTIEFVMDDYVGTTADAANIRNIMALTGNDAWIAANASESPTGGTPNDFFVIYQNRNASTVLFKVNSDTNTYRAQVSAASIDGVTNALTFQTGSATGWYQNASKQSTGTYGSATGTYNSAPSVGSSDTYQVIFGAAVDTVADRAFSGKVKAIRVYDRVLTETELAANAAADEERYTEKLTGSNVPAGYETDGLVLFLDGIDNTGTGEHSSASTKWVNLADLSESATFLTGGTNAYTWTEDGLTVNGGVILPASALATVDSSNFTVEFYIENYNATPDSTIRNVLCLIGPDGSVAGNGGAVWDDDFVSFQNSSGMTWNCNYVCFDIKNDSGSAFGRVSVSAASINDTTNAIAFDSTKSVTWLQNGVSKSTGKNGAGADWSTGIDLTNGTRLLFGAASGYISSRAFSGEIKAIRIYNRTLTAEELKTNAAADTLRYSDVDVDALAQESWDNVIGNTGDLGANTTLTGIRAYAASQLADSTLVTVDVTDAGNGAYTFTYKLASTGTVLNTHTLYVDTEYTVDMSELTAAEQAELLNDLVQFKGGANNTITVKWDDESKAVYYKGTDPRPRPVTHLYFPVYNSGDAYVFEAEIGFDAYGGWSTLAFAAETFQEHYQYAFWGSSSATGAEFVRHFTFDGSSFATGHQNVSMSIVAELLGDKMTAAYTQDGSTYKVKDTVTYKVIVYEGVLYGFIEGVQVLTTVASGSIYKDFNGVFGFNTSTSALNIHKISVRPLTGENLDEELAGVKLSFNPISAYNVDLYEPDTDINAAPIVLQSATSEVKDISGEAKRPSAIIFDLKVKDGVLSAYDGETKLGAWAELYAANCKKANVGVRIALGDLAAAEALADWVKANGAGNLWLISNDVEVLETVTDAAATVRGVVDFTGDTIRGPGNIKYSFDNDGTAGMNTAVGGDYANSAVRTFDYVTYTGGYGSMTWAQMYDVVFAEGYRTVLLPESAITKDHVYFLQGSLVNVMVETDAATEEEFYDLIVTGVNGILSTSYDKNIACLESEIFNVDGEELLVRGGSIVGHRGDMGYAVKYSESLPENSVESIVSAAQSGASSVEFDMYMTLDGELVLNHNASIKGYFDYPEGYTGTRVSADVGITSRYWYGDLEYLVSTYNPNIKLQRLYELYEAVDTEYPELRLHHEIKDGRIETLNRTIELMDQYGLRDRSDMMCFTKSVVAYTNSMGISSQYLATVSRYTDDNRMYVAEMAYRDVNSTWHAGWGAINMDFVEELKHYGQTAYPWPTYSGNYAAYYVQGYQGFTTDAPHHTDDIIRELIPTIDANGNVTVIARTLAYHEEGTASSTIDGYTPITLPDYLDGWWETKVSDRANEYKLTGFEIIPISGDPVINGTTVTGEGVVAVRCKQTLTESDGGTASFWIYSNTFKVGPVYEIILGHTENGSVSASVTEARKGDIVTLTVTPDEEYQLDELVVTDENGNEVTVTDDQFVMPSGSVTITATFAFDYRPGTGGRSGGIPVADEDDEEDGTVEVCPPNAVVRETCPSAGFTDINANDWFHSYVDYVVANGIMKGDGGGKFAPNDTMTRAMAWTVLARLDGENVDGGNPWYAKAQSWSMADQVSDGTKPNEVISREQLATMLYRFIGEPAVTDADRAKLKAYSDADKVSGWAVDAMAWAVSKGIINGVTEDGSETILAPQRSADRAQVAAILKRFCEDR